MNNNEHTELLRRAEWLIGATCPHPQSRRVNELRLTVEKLSTLAKRVVPEDSEQIPKMAFSVVVHLTTFREKLHLSEGNRATIAKLVNDLLHYLRTVMPFFPSCYQKLIDNVRIVLAASIESSIDRVEACVRTALQLFKIAEFRTITIEKENLREKLVDAFHPQFTSVLCRLTKLPMKTPQQVTVVSCILRTFIASMHLKKPVAYHRQHWSVTGIWLQCAVRVLDLPWTVAEQEAGEKHNLPEARLIARAIHCWEIGIRNAEHLIPADKQQQCIRIILHRLVKFMQEQVGKQSYRDAYYQALQLLLLDDMTLKAEVSQYVPQLLKNCLFTALSSSVIHKERRPDVNWKQVSTDRTLQRLMASTRLLITKFLADHPAVGDHYLRFLSVCLQQHTDKLVASPEDRFVNASHEAIIRAYSCCADFLQQDTSRNMQVKMAFETHFMTALLYGRRSMKMMVARLFSSFHKVGQSPAFHDFLRSLFRRLPVNATEGCAGEGFRAACIDLAGHANEFDGCYKIVQDWMPVIAEKTIEEAAESDASCVFDTLDELTKTARDVSVFFKFIPQLVDIAMSLAVKLSTPDLDEDKSVDVTNNLASLGYALNRVLAEFHKDNTQRQAALQPWPRPGWMLKLHDVLRMLNSDNYPDHRDIALLLLGNLVEIDECASKRVYQLVHAYFCDTDAEYFAELGELYRIYYPIEDNCQQREPITLLMVEKLQEHFENYRAPCESALLLLRWIIVRNPRPLPVVKLCIRLACNYVCRRELFSVGDCALVSALLQSHYAAFFLGFLDHSRAWNRKKVLDHWMFSGYLRNGPLALLNNSLLAIANVKLFFKDDDPMLATMKEIGKMVGKQLVKRRALKQSSSSSLETADDGNGTFGCDPLAKNDGDEDAFKDYDSRDDEREEEENVDAAWPEDDDDEDGIKIFELAFGKIDAE